jgi:hypothetical protein
MKAGREHRVPLSGRALAILEKLAEAKNAEFVFPGQKPSAPLSTMALEMVLRRMKVEDVTVHGFRSAFRDWCGEETSFPREIAEAALAHVAGDATERAYRRGDALEKRRGLMKAWAQYLEHESRAAKVVALDRLAKIARYRAAIPALPAILARLLPGGRIEGRQFVARNPRRADRRLGSFKINLRSGCWCDFATGEQRRRPDVSGRLSR